MKYLQYKMTNMETRTKMILALVGAGVATLVIYMITKRRSSGAQMQASVMPSAPVPVINYSNKPAMGLSAFSDAATGKPNMKGVVFEQRLSGQSDQTQIRDGVFKPRMG